MEQHCVPSALQEFPQLRQLSFVSSRNQGVIVDYVVYLR